MNRNKTLLGIFFMVWMAGGVYAQKISGRSSSFPAKDSAKKADITCKIINAADHSFGYDIYLNGVIFLHQVTVPSMPGNMGFPSRTTALLTAQLVIQKIKAGQMPPTISPKELKDIKAIK